MSSTQLFKFKPIDVMRSHVRIRWNKGIESSMVTFLCKFLAIFRRSLTMIKWWRFSSVPFKRWFSSPMKVFTFHHPIHLLLKLVQLNFNKIWYLSTLDVNCRWVALYEMQHSVQFVYSCLLFVVSDVRFNGSHYKYFWWI